MIYRRIFLIVLDSVGAGAMPDAGDYGDAGADTLGHILLERSRTVPVTCITYSRPSLFACSQSSALFS